MKRRGTAFLLTAVILAGTAVSLIGCGSTEKTEAEDTQSAAVSETKTADMTESIEYYDPFEGVFIECSGKNGDISVKVDYSHARYDESAYTVESETEGLSSGDRIDISVSDSAAEQTEESEGLTPIRMKAAFYAVADEDK